MLDGGLKKLLTKREEEVLGLMVQGFSNPIIAGKMCVTNSTVKAHVGHIFMKLGVANRTLAVVKAIREGLV